MLSDDSVKKKDIGLASLRSCKVFIQQSLSAVHLNKIFDSVIILGPVSGSIFVEDCQNTTLVVLCHQVLDSLQFFITFFLLSSC